MKSSTFRQNQSRSHKNDKRLPFDPANKYELVPMTVDSEGLVEAIQKYNDLLISRDNAIKTVSSKNEALKRLDNRIAATRQSLLSTIEQAYKNAEVAVNDLYRQMNTTSGSLGKIPNQERTYIDMERQRRVKQELYLFLLERQEENAIPSCQRQFPRVLWLMSLILYQNH